MTNEKRLAYATAVVETRVLEKRLIGPSLMRRLLKEQSPKSIETALRAAGYRGITPGNLNKENFDELLRGALEGFSQEVLDIVPDAEILDLLFLDYDIFNIKAVLMHQDPCIRFESSLMHIPAARAVRYRLLVEGASPGVSFWDELFAAAHTLYQKEGAKAVQEMLDRRYYKALLSIAERIGVPLCLQYAKAKIDFYNILSMLRLARLASAQSNIPVNRDEMLTLYQRILVPGGTIALETLESMRGVPIQQWILLADGTGYRDHLMTGLREYSYGTELTSLERCMDDCLTQMMKRYQSVALGPEPLLGYLHGRRIEVLNLRLVLTSLFLGVPRHTVAERLRESYA